MVDLRETLVVEAWKIERIVEDGIVDADVAGETLLKC